MKTAKLLLVMLFSIGVVACGGGGGDGTNGGAGAITATANTTAQSLRVNTAMTSFTPLSASGGTAPYTYSYTGTLPTGLSYNASSGAVTGTPTATYSTANLLFSVKDANNVAASTTSTVSFTVGAASISATATTTAQSLTVGVVMTSFSPLTPSGGATPYTYSITSGTLPAGLSLNTSTGVVTGTPTATLATANVVFSVQDANGVTAHTTCIALTTCTVRFTVASTRNDTGIPTSQCYQAGSDVLVACSSAGAISLNNAQDGMVGLDVNPATNSDSDGLLGFNFSFVGGLLGGCVRDNVTGLTWEIKTNDGDLYSHTQTFTNYDSTTSAQKWNGSTYVNPAQYEINAGNNSVGYINIINSVNNCGYSDWRLPTADELQSIVDYGVAYPGPTIDSNRFPNTQGGYYWVSSGNPTYALIVTFDYGDIRFSSHGNPAYIRLVRGDHASTVNRFTVSSDSQEVTDNKTKLIWRRCAEGMVLNGDTCIGTAAEFTHELALVRATDVASLTAKDWRLPNIKELNSIDKVLTSIGSPIIDANAFPATPGGYYWSSTPRTDDPAYAWYTQFGDGPGFSYGDCYGSGRTCPRYVRLVRDGQ